MDLDEKNLLAELGAANATDFRLRVLEALGMLLLGLHWQRGILDSFVQKKKIKMTPIERVNWDRVIRNLETYEEFLWEICPPRALLPALRHRRFEGVFPEGVELLLSRDDLGRIPYSESNVDDIEDILRKVKDVRKHRTGSIHRKS